MSVMDGLEVFLSIWASVATRLDKLVLKTNGHKSKSYGGFESPLAHTSYFNLLLGGNVKDCLNPDIFHHFSLSIQNNFVPLHQK